MNRTDAIEILETMLSEAHSNGENRIYFSGREALKVAIADMKYIQEKINKKERLKENMRNMTEQDWKESMQAVKDSWENE